MSEKAKLPATVSEAQTTLAAAAEAGKRLKKVAIEDGALVLQGTEEAQQRMEVAFGSADREFHTYCLAQLLIILPESAGGDDYTLPINAAIAMLTAIAPKNEMEAMLAVQMVASHHLTMLSMRRTKTASMLPQLQANGNMANKFARTHAAQVEALSRLRRGGEQVVRHVHVNEGGQALIAGTVNTGGAKNG